MVKIASWNVNSVKARLPNVLAWAREAAPDILLLQELKCEENAFPALEFGDLGYNLAVVGQKTYNGVAILSKSAIEVDHRRLPGGSSNEQARYVEGFTLGVRVASIYLPNGNPIAESGRRSDKFAYKLAWMERLYHHVRDLLAGEDATVLGGDFNVIPEPEDVHDPEIWERDALYHAESRAAFRKVIFLGLTDAFRARHPTTQRYTWWDYQSGAWARDEGARIDHLLLSPQAADRLAECDIDRKPRGREKASDHTPIWCALRDK
ncbi:MAG: exodeoxyribonuclease III [Rhodospirillales bacterium]|nr:exodeoxyribonuclease III [Rhodospirillales bacterium]